MPDTMRPLPFGELLDWILAEYRCNGSVFGIPHDLFYRPRPEAPYAIPDLYGHYLATPIGPAAGPHTQMAQNIVAAWLSGARFIELKTVQVMDELEIPRPCIDLADEGYNVEWSQELKLEQSRQEYVKAWVLIHALNRLLGFADLAPWGTVFNMSVGYNLQGIQSQPMVTFMDGLDDASDLVSQYQAVAETYPELRGLRIPTRITDNVTLSTMHGCPPDEIERIARYLLLERGLHTIVKLNPTLLGRDEVLHILHDRLGYREIDIPAPVFDHDLQYDRAVQLIRALRATAQERGLHFGVKLSNTLAMNNHRGVLPGQEMYMSGRALYPVTMNLFLRLSSDLGSALLVSYSAGADALNLPAILAAGARPVTAASDLLKPGGYSRLRQYLENLEREMTRRGAKSLDELAQDASANLRREAAACLDHPRYHRSYHLAELPKVSAGLGLFDCIAAPCMEQCPIGQHVPNYAWHLAHGRPDQALEAILARNPLPAVTGFVCNHLCQTRCTQHNYEQPVAIRALKRFAAEHGKASAVAPPARTSARVAVVGSGPSGLAAAAALALSGVPVTVFEAGDRLGGLLAGAVPPFRLPSSALQADLERIRALGVRFEMSHPVAQPTALLAEGFAAVYVATGAPQSIPLGIPGEESPGVHDALSLLNQVRRQADAGLPLPSIGEHVLVIGGGNSAVDAARTARRLGAPSVTLVYRRTRREMPAIPEEVEAALTEGVSLKELTIPVRIVRSDEHVAALECQRAVLGQPGPDGRQQPVPVAGSEHTLVADAIIVAIGQRPLAPLTVDAATAATPHPAIYAGGDAVRGPATVIQAIADGRRAAEAICRELGLTPQPWDLTAPELGNRGIVRAKTTRARRLLPAGPTELPPARRTGFRPVELPLSKQAARQEAARCLQCASLCDKCVEVCPNRANYAYTVPLANLAVPVLACADGDLQLCGTEPFRLTQTRQILHVDDLCNACGNCETFCVHQGKPFRDKPRLFLRRSDFQREQGNAFHLTKGRSSWVLRRREAEGESELRLSSGYMVYEDAQVKVILSPDWLVEELVLKQPFPGQRTLFAAAELFVVLKGITESLSFLPIETEQD